MSDNWVSVEEEMSFNESDSFEHHDSCEVITFDGRQVQARQCSAGRYPDFWCKFEDGLAFDITQRQPLPPPPNKE